MGIRTDLVLEESETEQSSDGIDIDEQTIQSFKITTITVKNAAAEKRLSKPQGKYITIEFESFGHLSDYEEITKALVKSLNFLLPEDTDNILLVGLGNSDITPDALGPLTANKILATRHIDGGLAEELGLTGLKSVSVITPSVLGKTGIETAELVSSAAERVSPSAIITIDALAARNASRLCNTIQLTDSGISPGSGVQNSRRELSRKNMGVPVIAIGVPTVVDIAACNFECDGKTSESKNMIVTPKDIDRLLKEASEIISRSLNIFLQPEIDEDILLNLV